MIQTSPAHILLPKQSAESVLSGFLSHAFHLEFNLSPTLLKRSYEIPELYFCIVSHMPLLHWKILLPHCLAKCLQRVQEQKYSWIQGYFHFPLVFKSPIISS